MDELHQYTFRQLGTKTVKSITASNQAEAKKLAAQTFGCRESSCLCLPPNGQVKMFTLKNWTTKQRHKIKADDFESAREEMAAATDTTPDEWILRAEEIVNEKSMRDIEYLTFDSTFA